MPITTQPERLRAFNLEVEEVAKQSGCERGWLLSMDSDADNLIEDSVNLDFPINHQTAATLRARFLNRLASLVCGCPEWCAPTIALMRVSGNQVAIWLAKPDVNATGDAILCQAIADLLKRIQKRGASKIFV
jgi:hypothetical protein